MSIPKRLSLFLTISLLAMMGCGGKPGQRANNRPGNLQLSTPNFPMIVTDVLGRKVQLLQHATTDSQPDTGQH